MTIETLEPVQEAPVSVAGGADSAPNNIIPTSLVVTSILLVMMPVVVVWVAWTLAAGVLVCTFVVCKQCLVSLVMLYFALAILHCAKAFGIPFRFDDEVTEAMIVCTYVAIAIRHIGKWPRRTKSTVVEIE